MQIVVSRLRPLLFSVVAFSLYALGASEMAASETVKIRSSATWYGRSIELTGHLSKPSRRGKAPVVMLMHGCGGLGGAVTASLNAHARHLNRNGFATIVLDSFGPRAIGGGKACSDIPELTAALRYRQTDARDTLRWLKKRTDLDGDNVFVMGQSNGGSVAINLAQAGGFRAVAAYYPWCGVLSPGRPRSALIVFGGGRDNWTPPAQCRGHKADHRYEYVQYGAAAHSFDVNSGLTSYLGHRVGYNAAATADSRKRMIAFFRKHMR